ncbi:MAG: TnsD family Tn7-like transposition protein [Sedimenticola sp.]
MCSTSKSNQSGSQSLNKIGLYVPKPYPDELLYSLFGRFGRHLGIRSPKHVLDNLFESRTTIATVDLPSRLSRLRWLIEGRWNVQMEEAIWERTLFPYYAAYRPEVQVERFISAMIEDSPHNLHTTMGVCATSVAIPQNLRFCQDCKDQDLEGHGETYWRRSHQLPGVLVCPIHGKPLINSNISLRPLGRHEFTAASNVDTLAGTFQEPVKKKDWEMARRIASKCDELLRRPSGVQEGLSHAELITELSSKGFIGSYGEGERLENEFIQFYGESLLGLLEPTLHEKGTLPWLRQMHLKPDRRLQPIRYIMLELFLSQIGVKPVEMPFGKGPWRCMNWLSDHYQQPVVEQMEIIPTKRGSEGAVGRFTCSCGFQYTQDADRIDQEKPKSIVRFGPLFDKRSKELKEQGLSTRAVAKMLGVDWKTADRMISGNGDKEARREQEQKLKIKQDQAAWLALIDENRDLGVKAVRDLDRALYARLYRNCKEWLQRHSPKKQTRTAVKRRIDWDTRDSQLRDRVQEEADVIRSEFPMRQLTRNLIGRRLGCPSLFEKKLELLPKTAEVLSQVCESLEEYQERRISTLIFRSDKPLKPWEIQRSAGLRREVFVERMRSLAEGVDQQTKQAA